MQGNIPKKSTAATLKEQREAAIKANAAANRSGSKIKAPTGPTP